MVSVYTRGSQAGSRTLRCTHGRAAETRTRGTAGSIHCSFCAGRSNCYGGWFCQSCRHRFFAAAGALALWRRAFRRLNHHQAGDKFLHPVDIKVNRGAVGVSCRNHAEPVLKVLDVLTFRETFQDASLGSVHRTERKKGASRWNRDAPIEFTEAERSTPAGPWGPW